jgi:hypothetical protein
MKSGPDAYLIRGLKTNYLPYIGEPGRIAIDDYIRMDIILPSGLAPNERLGHI